MIEYTPRSPGFLLRQSDKRAFTLPLVNLFATITNIAITLFLVSGF